jgi:signal transduction histidine kinase
VRDVALAVVMTAVTLAGAWGEAHPGQPGDRIQNGHPAPVTPTAAFLLVAISGLVLADRRRRPHLVLAISTGAVAVYSVLGYVNGAALLNPLLALYFVAAGSTAWRAVSWATGVLVLLEAATVVRDPFGPTGGAVVLLPGLVAAALFAGIAVSNRRAYIDELQARALEETRRQVDDERLRIARELHDVVAHSMATINVSAGVALHVLDRQPQAAAEALAVIKALSKDGLRELRVILNVLRHADEADSTHPTPGLAQLPALVSAGNRAGLPTTVTVTGQPRPLPEEVDLTAYRILQEALTNAIRHAGPATAQITLDYRDDELRLHVTDTGTATSSPSPVLTSAASTSAAGSASAIGSSATGTGHGLTGMAERAAALAGSVQTGREPTGGFGVHARLPIDPAVPLGGHS